MAPVPLAPLQVISTPFRYIGVDIVGPVEKSQAGNKFILVICDYAARYLEAIPLREVTAKQVATGMLKFFSGSGGNPKRGVNRSGPLLHESYTYKGLSAVRHQKSKNHPHHPQTDGLVECFTQTLKSMLRKFVSETGKDKWLPFPLFAYCEVPQASTGFSPFKLLFGHQVSGPLDVLRRGQTSSVHWIFIKDTGRFPSLQRVGRSQHLGRPLATTSSLFFPSACRELQTHFKG